MSDHRSKRSSRRSWLRESPLIVIMWVLILAYLIWALVGAPMP